jgi:Flavin-binding monooxygenase-like
VGNSASGIDVSVQIAAIAQRPLLVSERSESPAYLNDNPAIKIVPEIAEFLIPDRAVRFANGHIEKNVDHVLLCTGYLYSFPFLSSLLPPAVTADGNRPSNLFQHIFYYPRPTLTFIGLPQKIIPFPLSEAQAAVIARVYSGRLQLPSLSEMMTWEANWIAKHGSGKTFNVLGYPLDAEYLNSLHDWSLHATRRNGLDNDGRGKHPPYWNEKDQWLRKLTPMIKAASQALGSKRRDITALEELGFVYQGTENDNDSRSKI